MPVKYLIRFDDITPNMAWSKFSLLEKKMNSLNIKPIVGVVPNNKDKKLDLEDSNIDFWGNIKTWFDNDWTIAQHGYTHQYETTSSGLLKINKRSEFSQLSFEKQLIKLEKGKKILENYAVWQPIFMAPAHSFDKNTIKALKSLEFKYITDGYGFYPYRVDDLLLIPQLFSSSIHFGFGVYTICIHINTMPSEKIDMLINFMEENREDIITFQEAVSFENKNFLVSSVSRIVCFYTLIFIRRIKSLVLRVIK